MKYLLIIILMATVCTVKAQGIKFEENLTWAQIKAKAKAENKYIMMDTYTTWCGPCKFMSTETFPKKEAGDFINPKFIAVKVQMDKTKNDTEYVKSWYQDAKVIGDVYEVRAYPTVLYFSPEGNIVHHVVGVQDVNRLINEAKVALKNDDDYAHKLAEFKNGTLDTSAMKTLVTKAKTLKAFKIAQEVADKYISYISKNDLFKKDNLTFMGMNLSSKSKYFDLFLKNPGKVNAILGENWAESSIMKMIYREEIEPFDKLETPDWVSIEKKVVAKYGKLGEEQAWGSRTLYYNSIQDWVSFGSYYKKYFERAIRFGRSFIHINNLSWPVFEHVTDTTILNVAVKAMEFNIDKYQRYDAPAIDTYANLLYKVGRKEEAINWEDLGRRLSNNGKEYVETLEKMKAGTPTWRVEEPKK
jgi:thioredoxin-related protein